LHCCSTLHGADLAHSLCCCCFRHNMTAANLMPTSLHNTNSTLTHAFTLQPPAELNNSTTTAYDLLQFRLKRCKQGSPGGNKILMMGLLRLDRVRAVCSPALCFSMDRWDDGHCALPYFSTIFSFSDFPKITVPRVPLFRVFQGIYKGFFFKCSFLFDPTAEI
jgi:hypothetical protein